jgi:predicted dehydrogenase
MSGKLRIGVIGCGWWSTDYHMPGLLSHPDAVLAAASDPDAGHLKAALEAYHIPSGYADYREMLAREQLDGVIVATPHKTHFEIARDVLDSGLHLLLEKPMTLFAWEARALVELAGQRQREIVMGYHFPFYPHVQRARAVIAGGEFGPVQYVDSSYCSNLTHFLNGSVSEDNPGIERYTLIPPSASYNSPEQMGGGMGHLNLTHGIGLMLHVTGLRVKRVQAAMNNLGRALDMVDAFSVEFTNGALGIVGGTGNAVGTYRTSVAAYCEEGAYLYDSWAGFAGLRRKDGTREALEFHSTGSSRYLNTHAFIDCLKGQVPNPAPGELGWRVVELLDAAYRSVREGGRPVEITELYAP